MTTKELTIQVDETTHATFDKLCKGAGLSESAMFRVIVNKQADTREENAIDVPVEKPAAEKTLQRKWAKWTPSLRELASRNRKRDCEPDGFAKSLEEMRQRSQENGNCNMTMDEINAEIALARKEEREYHEILAKLRAATPWIDKSGLREVTDMFPDELEDEIEEYLKMGYEVGKNV